MTHAILQSKALQARAKDKAVKPRHRSRHSILIAAINAGRVKKYFLSLVLFALVSSCSVSSVNKKGEPRKISNSRGYFAQHPKTKIGF